MSPVVEARTRPPSVQKYCHLFSGLSERQMPPL